MQIGNPSINLIPLQPGGVDQKPNQRQAQQELERPSREQQAVLTVQELIRKGELKQIEQLESINRSENLSLKSKEALQQYQATEEAGQQIADGELLGIDIYV